MKNLTKKRIFVYGTLKSGFGLNPYMNNFKLLGIGKLKGFDMYSNGYFPMIVKGKGEVVGEVYEIENGETEIAVLDKIEGAYNRTKIKAKLNKNFTDVEAYIYKGDATNLQQVKNGVWS